MESYRYHHWWFPPIHNEIIFVMEAWCVSCDVGSELYLWIDFLFRRVKVTL